MYSGKFNLRYCCFRQNWKIIPDLPKNILNAEHGIKYHALHNEFGLSLSPGQKPLQRHTELKNNF